ncbi:hypothetical protein Pan258_05610 [Symmachiella dynata]|nr:hypothetical protein Pan258_05610 [Symmachiella dynata]
MNKFFTFALVAYGGWLLYMSVRLLLAQLPTSGLLFLASSLLAFTASFCLIKRKWRIFFVVFLLLYTVLDLSAVLFHREAMRGGFQF